MATMGNHTGRGVSSSVEAKVQSGSLKLKTKTAECEFAEDPSHQRVSVNDGRPRPVRYLIGSFHR
jgi:hypothetical protein